MASAANVFRKASVELLVLQLAALQRTAGIVFKAYRDYESPTKPSKTQTEVAAAAQTRQPVVSTLENGKTIPADQELAAIMRQLGLPVEQDAP